MGTLASLKGYFFRYKLHFLSGIIFVAATNIFGVYPAQVTRITIDFLIESNVFFSSLEGLSAQTGLFLYYSEVFLLFFAVILLSIFLKGLFMFFMRQTIIVMSRHIEFDQKNEIFDQYQKLNMSFYKKNNTGDLMARISEDVGQVRMFVGPAAMYTTNLVVTFIVVISAMLSISQTLTFYVLLPLPFLSFGVYKVSKIINTKSSRLQKQLSAISVFSQEAFSGIRVLKGFNREKFSSEKFEEESEKYKNLSLDLVRTDAYFQPLIAVLIGLSSIFTIFIGGREAIAGRITMGNIGEFIMYVNMLVWPVTALGWVTSIIQRASASQQRINEFLTIKPEIGNPTQEPFVLKGDIEFKNVGFTYPDTGIQAIKNLSFIVKQGSSLAITGKTGSGKSSVAALIMRFYDVSSGEIYIDGKKITSVNLYDLRNQTGYVPQDVFLFSETIAENIAFGLKNKNPEREVVHQAAKNAAIYNNIQQFPAGFDTLVGERGITLSGGQKQRISIARAIIKEPKLLIFDDCLSAVDTQTEDEILTNLKQLMKGKTSIIISHRVSSVKNAGHIIVLDNGKLSEEGTHEELIRKGGEYYRLYTQQLLADNKTMEV
jgi:ATP-binding cassette subfamily B multidrug efflux pump